MKIYIGAKMLTIENLCIRKWFNASQYLLSASPISLNIYRKLSSAEATTALRPFYFSVHPDLFGQYPEERSVNENSLKQLSSYLETVQQNQHATPLTLKFFLKPARHQRNRQPQGSLKIVHIQLSEKNLRKTVLSILKTCNLPTTYVDKISPEPERTKLFSESEARKFYEKLTKNEIEFYDNDPIFSSYISNKLKKGKQDDKLKSFLEKNLISSQDKLSACQPIRIEIEKLKNELCMNLGLKRIIWDCGWNISHFRGSLQSFSALSKHHPEFMTSLKGKTLIFGTTTGVNLDGHVVLNSGEVRHNWLDAIRTVQHQDEVLARLPAFEKAVSRVLRDIKIVHRKFQPKVIAKQYEKQLRRLITSLSDYQGKLGYPKHWPDKLSHLELVVETEAGPLMLSPTGQLIVPSSCPAFLVVNFISENLEKAAELLLEYKGNKYVEKDLHKQVLTEFNLIELLKDDNITPTLMISCCQRLLEHKNILLPLLNHSSLFITSYYSVLSDGSLCIPWNWKI